MVSAFLEDLEDTRRNAPETRNVRLAAIKSFFHFLEYQHPASLEQIRRVLAIPYKRTNTRLVPYLVREEVQALLDAPDPTTRDGIRDRAMLHLAVCAGLRVSELVGLRLNDISLPSMSIRVYGKGRRERALPLWKSTTTALRAWLAVRGTLAAPEVFVNLRGQPMSRWGVAYMLKQHAKTAGQHQANARVDGQKPNTRREHRTSGQRTVKSISINGAKRRFGDCARKAAELTPGDLLCVAELIIRFSHLQLPSDRLRRRWRLLSAHNGRHCRI
jgi:integrase